MNKPNYIVHADEPEYLVIKDTGPWNRYPTITNRPETVVWDLRDVLKNGRRLYYIDSTGQTDQLLHDGQGGFVDFKPGGPNGPQ